MVGLYAEADSSYDPSKTSPLELAESGINHPYYLPSMWHFQGGILTCGGSASDRSRTDNCVFYSMTEGVRDDYLVPNIPGGGRGLAGASFLLGR